MQPTKAKRRLSDFNFEGEGAHVALVSKKQGGPANGITTLITKSASYCIQSDTKQAVFIVEDGNVRLVELDAHSLSVLKSKNLVPASDVAVVTYNLLKRYNQIVKARDLMQSCPALKAL